MLILPGRFVPAIGLIVTLLPIWMKRSGNLFAVPSVFIQPTRAENVYPGGRVGLLELTDSNVETVVPSYIIHTEYQVPATDVPVSIPLTPDAATDADKETPLNVTKRSPPLSIISEANTLTLL